MAKIVVVGAGAVGSFFGGLLAKAGESVTLIGRAAHIEAIGKHGLRIDSKHGVAKSAFTALSSQKPFSLLLRRSLFCSV